MLRKATKKCTQFLAYLGLSFGLVSSNSLANESFSSLSAVFHANVPKSMRLPGGYCIPKWLRQTSNCVATHNMIKALQNDEFSRAQLLIQRQGAQLDLFSLGPAVLNQDSDLFLLLLEWGINPNNPMFIWMPNKTNLDYLYSMPIINRAELGIQIKPSNKLQRLRPLSMLALLKQLSLAELLLQKKLVKAVDINAQDQQLNTALHYATYIESPLFVRLLLQNGANRENKNRAGLQALDIAKSLKNQELIDILQ